MKCTIIGVAGGTGSGKSTFTNRLKEAFGDQISVIYYDNYYRAQDEIPFEERKKVNYDSPESLETELLIAHLSQLKEGTAIQCPVYDYTKHDRSSETVTIEPKKVMIAGDLSSHHFHASSVTLKPNSLKSNSGSSA